MSGCLLTSSSAVIHSFRKTCVKMKSSFDSDVLFQSMIPLSRGQNSQDVAYFFYFTVRLNAGKPERVFSKTSSVFFELLHAKYFTSSMISCCHASHRAQAHYSGFHLLDGDSHRWRRAGNNSEKH